MLTAFRQAAMKTQLRMAILFFLGYVSPLVALLIFGWVKLRKLEKSNGYAVLLGAATALLLYVMNYVYLMVS